MNVDDACVSTWNQVRNDKDPLHWMILRISDDSKSINVAASGEKGIEELVAALKDLKGIMYAGFRVTAVDDRGSVKSLRAKFVMIALTTPEVSQIKKARAGPAKGEVDSIFNGLHGNVVINSAEELTREMLHSKLMSTTAAHRPTGYEFDGVDSESYAGPSGSPTSPKPAAEPVKEAPKKEEAPKEEPKKVEQPKKEEEAPAKAEEEKPMEDEKKEEETKGEEPVKEESKAEQEQEEPKKEEPKKEEPKKEPEVKKEPEPKNAEPKKTEEAPKAEPLSGDITPEQAWNKVRDDKDPLNWVMLSYDKQPSQPIILASGNGRLEEFKDNLQDDQITFGALKVKAIDDRGSVQSVRTKFIFVQMNGTQVKPIKRASAGPARATYEGLLQGCHISVHIQKSEDLDEKDLVNRLQKSCGAHAPTGYEL